MQCKPVVQKLKQTGQSLLAVQNLIAADVLAFLICSNLVLQKDHGWYEGVRQDAGHKAALGNQGPHPAVALEAEGAPQRLFRGVPILVERPYTERQSTPIHHHPPPQHPRHPRSPRHCSQWGPPCP